MRKTMVTSEPIVLGKVGENEVNKVLFPVRGWKELYGDGEFGLVALLPGENEPYPVPISEYTLNGEFVEWVIRSSDVAYDGRGKVELRYSVAIPDTTPVEYKRVKSVVYDTIIWDALGTNSLEPPEPWQPWIDDVEAKAVRAEDAAEYAEAAQGLAEDARDAAEDARDDARDARDAAEGFADDAHIAQLAAEGSAADADRYAEAALESAQSAATEVSTAFGQITATADTLSPGSSATASFDPSTKVMSFGIPKGDQGPGGESIKNILLTSSGGTYTISQADGLWIIQNTPADSNNRVTINAPFVFYANGRTYYPMGISVSNGGRNIIASLSIYNGSIPDNANIMTRVLHIVINADGTVYSCANDSIVLETAGKITIGANYYTTGTTYTVTRKALAITENGVTTTYYVADIT